MRFGWILSLAAHALAVAMTLIAWPLSAREAMPDAGAVVPIDVVDIGALSNVRAMAPPEPEEDAALEDEETPDQANEAPAETAPAPNARAPSLDLAALQRDLLRDRSKAKERTRPRGEGAPGDQLRPRVGEGTADIATLEDRLRSLVRAHIRRNQCWRSPVDQPDFERLVVTIRFQVDARGAVRGQPQVISPRSTLGDPIMRAAVSSARNAILACSPFPFPDDPAVADHYDLWRDMEYTFRPEL